jgi:hypothetical protein
VFGSKILAETFLDGPPNVPRCKEGALQDIRDCAGIISGQVMPIERYIHSEIAPGPKFSAVLQYIAQKSKAVTTWTFQALPPNEQMISPETVPSTHNAGLIVKLNQI